MKRISFIIFFCMLMSVNALGAQAPKLPKVDAHGAVLMDFKTGRVLWEKNSQSPLANASTTKIMTAIVALERGKLEDTVKISHRATTAPEVKMDLTKGEEIKLEYLMYALMLQSSNDAAIAIAEHIAGNVEEFCLLMTEKGRDLGAYDTIFETPNGLDRGEHHSTAYDMALITRYALNNPEFMRIINTQEVIAKSSKRTYNIANRNRLLHEYEGGNGVKTGFTNKAGHCFVGAARRNDMQLISVVLGSGWGEKGKEQKWRDTKEILNYGFASFTYKDIISKGVVADYVEIDRSKTPKVGIFYSEGLVMPVTQEEADNIKILVEAPDKVKAPVDANVPMGIAKVYLGDKVYKEIPLLTDASAQRHDLKTSMEKVINNWLEMGTTQEVNIKLIEF